MAALATAFIRILPDTSAIRARLGASVSGEADRAGATAGQRFSSRFGSALKIGGFLAGALAVGAGAEFLKGAVTEASNLGESLNAVNVTFGDNAAGIKQLGEEAANAVGLSKNEFNSLAVQFSSFATSIAGKGGDVVGTMDELTTRGADFASVMNLDVNEAMSLFQSGLAGESEPLRKFGIDLSAAKVEAFAYADGIAKAGKPLTEQQKVQARYGLLMRQTAKTQGDFANTSDSLANSQRRLGANFKNIQASVGQALIPTLERLSGWFVNDAVPAIQKFIAEFKAGEGTAGSLRKALETVGAVLLTVGGFLVNNATAVAAVTIAVLAGVAAYKTYRLVVAASAAIQAGYAAATYGSAGATYVAGAASKVYAVLMIRQRVATIASTVAQYAAAAAARIWAGAQLLLNAAMRANPIGLVITALFALGAGLVLAYKKSSTFRNIVNGAFAAVRRVVGVVVRWFGRYVPQVFAFVVGAVKAYIGVYRRVIVTAFNVVRAVVTAVMRVVRAVVTTSWNAIRAVVTNVVRVIAAVVRTYFNIYKTIILTVMRAARAVVQAAWSAIRSIVTSAIAGVIRAVRGVAVVVDFFRDAFGRAREAVAGKVREILGVVRGIPGQVRSALGNLASTLFSAGAALIQGLINGILSKIQDVRNAIGNLAGIVKGALPGSPVKWGPLTSWNNGGAGKRLVQLLADGLGDTGPIDAAMRRVTGRVQALSPVARIGSDMPPEPGSRIRSLGVRSATGERESARGVTVNQTVYARDEAAAMREASRKFTQASLLAGLP